MNDLLASVKVRSFTVLLRCGPFYRMGMLSAWHHAGSGHQPAPWQACRHLKWAWNQLTMSLHRCCHVPKPWLPMPAAPADACPTPPAPRPVQGSDAPRRLSQGGDIEAGPPPPPEPAHDEKDRHMDEFFREVSAIKVQTLPLTRQVPA